MSLWSEKGNKKQYSEEIVAVVVIAGKLFEQINSRFFSFSNIKVKYSSAKYTHSHKYDVYFCRVNSFEKTIEKAGS